MKPESFIRFDVFVGMSDFRARFGILDISSHDTDVMKPESFMRLDVLVGISDFRARFGMSFTSFQDTDVR